MNFGSEVARRSLGRDADDRVSEYAQMTQVDEVTTAHWKAFAGAYLGWTLVGFDFMILSFLLMEIQTRFGVNAALAGSLATATLVCRVIGGVGAGNAADRWGRKGPLMLSILWYAIFAFLGGFSTSFAMLWVCRALFGIGFGGVWSAGIPLAIEHWPTRLRGVVSGTLQGGFSVGYILAAATYQFGYPLVQSWAFGWRVLLWLGILPVLVVVWIRRSVPESPIWLARRPCMTADRAPLTGSFARLFEKRLLPVTLHSLFLLASLLFLYYSITWWYPTRLGELGRQTLPFMAAFNGGAIVGSAVCGRLSETFLGRRGAAAMATLLGITSIPLFLFATSTPLLVVGAAAMGCFGTGNLGVVPGYLAERFPTSVRAGGSGFAYQMGAALAAIAPTMVGWLQDTGLSLGPSMAWCIAASGVVTIALLWIGPETRGIALDS